MHVCIYTVDKASVCVELLWHFADEPQKHSFESLNEASPLVRQCQALFGATQSLMISS